MKIYPPLTLLIALLMLTGCAVIPSIIPSAPPYLETAATQSYGVAVEERKTGAIVSDKKIVLAIQKRYAAVGLKINFDVSPFCYNGHVFLIGEYETPADKLEALEIASRVEKVKSITIYLLPKNNPDACGMLESIAVLVLARANLIADPEIKSTNIDVKVVQCRVVLLGVVGTQKEIDTAVADVKDVAGVLGVENFLESTIKE